MARMIISPEKSRPLYEESKVTVFLGGSIEMGRAEDWQTKIHAALNGLYSDADLALFNPRRTEWDATWSQENKPGPFQDQVNWELSRITLYSDIVCFYFDPNTTSPISLLELGLVTGMLIHGQKYPLKCVVYCPPEYFRKGNVDITCELANIPVFNTYEDFLQALIKTIDSEL